MVLGILGVCCPLATALAAIVCGHLARRRIRQSQGTLFGAGQALAGLGLGYATLVMWVVFLAYFSVVAKRHLPLAVSSLYAQKVELAMRKMVADGIAKHDAARGWPADAGIATVAELKKRLVEGGYLSPEVAEATPFDHFLIGNVSHLDAATTTLIRVRPERIDGGTIVIRKDGERQVTPGPEDIETESPPREPPYLEGAPTPAPIPSSPKGVDTPGQRPDSADSDQ